MMVALRMSSTGLVVGMIFTYSSCPTGLYSPFSLFFAFIFPCLFSDILAVAVTAWLFGLRNILIPSAFSDPVSFLLYWLASLRWIVTPAWHRIHTLNLQKHCHILPMRWDVEGEFTCTIQSYLLSMYRRNGEVKRCWCWGQGILFFPQAVFFDYFLFGCTPVSLAYTLSLFCDTAPAKWHSTRREGTGLIPCNVKEGRQKNQGNKKKSSWQRMGYPPSAASHFYFYFFRKVEGEHGTRNLSDSSFLFFLHAHFRSMYWKVNLLAWLRDWGSVL